MTTLPRGATGERLPAGVLPPGTRIDRWEVRKVLGQGATGVVYEIVHLQLGTRHALKVLSWAHPHLQARLLAEGRAQAALHHPNIVGVRDMMQVGEAPALLLDLVDGPSLEAWLRDKRPTAAECLELFNGILDGVGVAHAAGIVHRDLKPANVLLARIDGRWVPKVTDFGLAKWNDSDLGLTGTGMTMGTPAYMAPEQIRNARGVDKRADIFALGCILYELLSGEPPHGGDDPLAMMNAVAEGRVTPIRELVPGLPQRVYRAVELAMAVDLDQRLASCEAFQACLDEEPPSLAVEGGAARMREALGLSRQALRVDEDDLDDDELFDSVAPSEGVSRAVQGLARVGAVLAGTLGGVALGIVLLGGAVRGTASEAVPRASTQAAIVLDAASRVPEEPFVEDDQDATLRPFVKVEVDEEVELLADLASPAQHMPAEGEQAQPGDAGCTSVSGWVRVPWHWRVGDGDWSPKKAIDVHGGTPEAAGPVLCTLNPSDEMQVVGEPVRAVGSRWIRVTPK